MPPYTVRVESTKKMVKWRMFIPNINLTSVVAFMSNPIVCMIFFYLLSKVRKFVKARINPKYQVLLDTMLDGLVWWAENTYGAKTGALKFSEVNKALAQFDIKVPASVIEAAVERLHAIQKDEKYQAAIIKRYKAVASKLIV